MYENNYDAHLKNQEEIINLDNYVYLLVEGNNRNKHGQKFAPIAEATYKVKHIDYKTVFPKNMVRSVENCHIHLFCWPRS